ncbi:hypothetical protein FQN54_006113 [Arachnomyces sp. PD_36]|nr:hypothetical protein FQN54_006113 [Arachnomyces sp. PD_36]
MSQFKDTYSNPNPPIPAHKFAGSYTSPLLLSLPRSTDLQSRYAHLNCSFVSPQLRHGHKAVCSSTDAGGETPPAVAPTLVDLKRHVQSLCNLIVDLTAWEGPIDACYNPQHNDKNAFDWLDSLRSNTPYATYPPDDEPQQHGNTGQEDIEQSEEPWQSAPLTSVLNRHWEPPSLSPEEKRRSAGRDKDQLPPVQMPCPLARDYSGPEDIGTLVAHANSIFEELEERLVDKGGILALYPVSSGGEFGVEEEEEGRDGDVNMGGVDDGSDPSPRFKRPTTSLSALEASRSTIFGQYLSYTSALAHRVTTLEGELEAAQQALAGEACVPHVLANGVIPTGAAVDASSESQTGNYGSSAATGTSSGPILRPLVSSQDRYVLANLSPELDARISSRLSHDSRARQVAEREAHEKIRPGRTRTDYVPLAPRPRQKPDTQYRSSAASAQSTKRRHSIEETDEDEENHNEAVDQVPEHYQPAPTTIPPPPASSLSSSSSDSEDENPNSNSRPQPGNHSPSPTASSGSSPPPTPTSNPNSILDPLLDMDVDDTLLPSSRNKHPLTPISYVDIPARAYRLHDAAKTIFIVLGVGMGPEVRVGGGVVGKIRTDRKAKGVRAVVGREELISEYKKWRKGKAKEEVGEKGEEGRKEKGRGVRGRRRVSVGKGVRAGSRASVTISGPSGSVGKRR